MAAKASLQSVRACLCDLSGTLHVEDAATPRAVEALQRLRGAGIKIKFVSNTTKESASLLHRRLTSLGFVIEPSEIFTSLTAAKELVMSKKLRPILFLEDAALGDFHEVPGIVTASQARESEASGRDLDANAVVIGLNPSQFDYQHLNTAFRVLHRGGASLIAIHKGKYFATSSGISLGPGPFVHGLEFATGIKAEVVGKPSKEFFQLALDSLDVSAENACMIGDDLDDDVLGAQRAGIRGFLVRTGKYRGVERGSDGEAPTNVFDNFAEFVDHLLASMSS